MRKLHFNFKINRLTRYFLLSDFVVLAAWGLSAPVFSVYVIERVSGATLVTVGIAAGLYWFIKSLIQIPVGELLDESGEKTGFYVIIAGLVIVAVSAFGFIFVRTVPQLYVVQLIHAIGFGLYVPAWLGSYSRHLDRGHDSFEWGLQSTTAGLAHGMTGFFGGAIAFWFGYPAVFISAGVFSFLAIGVLFFIPDLVFPRDGKKSVVLADHTPKDVA